MGEKSESKKLPDIVIIHSKEKGKKVYPIFLIELKEDFKRVRLRRVTRDLNKLSSFTKKYGNDLEQTYFIYAVLDKKYRPKKIDKMIFDLIPDPQDEYIVPITINVLGERLLLKEMENFERKVSDLRKFRKR